MGSWVGHNLKGVSTLSITQRVLAYEDPVASNNPSMRPFDWSRQIQGICVENPSTHLFKVSPLQSVCLFDGTSQILSDDTTQYSIAVSLLASNRYRMSWTGVGTNPVFRTARSVTWTNPTNVTIIPQINQSVELTTDAGSIFGNVVEGDVLYIPGVSTGDLSGIFNPLNEGYWVVLSALATSLILTREPNCVYSALAQTVTLTTPSSIQIFSSSGVQVYDTLALVAGFPTSMLQSFEIASVTATSIDFLSGSILPPISAVVPGINSVVIFRSAKSWMMLETNQNIQVALNGNQSFSVIPILPGDPNKIGQFSLMSSVYSLVVTNNSMKTASVRILSSE